MDMTLTLQIYAKLDGSDQLLTIEDAERDVLYMTRDAAVIEAATDKEEVEVGPFTCAYVEEVVDYDYFDAHRHDGRGYEDHSGWVIQLRDGCEMPKEVPLL